MLSVHCYAMDVFIITLNNKQMLSQNKLILFSSNFAAEKMSKMRKLPAIERGKIVTLHEKGCSERKYLKN